MKLLYTGQRPTRAYPDDAGLDLTCTHGALIEPGEFADIELGCSILSPSGHWAMLVSRSSTLRRRGLLMSPGVIDPGYTGPLYVGVMNLTQEPVEVLAGERLAQLIVFENRTMQIELVEVGALPETPRGSNGFGSSGR